jgi:hypothetical protein
MKNVQFVITCLLVCLFPTTNFGQCTEANDADMAKYKRLTETQDAQGCSQCAMLALYFCSATYSDKAEDKRKVSSLISACKRNIQNMGQPYCCPELLNKQPQWGINANSKVGNNSASTSTSVNGNFAQTQKPTPPDNTLLINNLLTNLETNPDNPLKIDKALLESVANIIPEGNLKSKLLSYSANLGLDENLSIRQVYYDLNYAFTSNNQTSSLSQYSDTEKGLDILFNNQEQLFSSIKVKMENYKPGIFMNDPAFINNLSRKRLAQLHLLQNSMTNPSMRFPSRRLPRSRSPRSARSPLD